MKKLFLVLTAVVALTAASRAVVVSAQDDAPEAMVAAESNMIANEVMNEAVTLGNAVEAMGAEVLNEVGNVANEAVEPAAAAGEAMTY